MYGWIRNLGAFWECIWQTKDNEQKIKGTQKKMITTERSRIWNKWDKEASNLKKLPALSQ
jgi:hypothetical protein